MAGEEDHTSAWLTEPKEEVLFEGDLKKKSDKAVWGTHLWNGRRFVLLKNTGQLLYYSSKRKRLARGTPLGIIPIDRIQAVTPIKGKAKRFNIVMENEMHIFELEAASPAIAEKWASMLNEYPRGRLKPVQEDTGQKFWKMAKQLLNFYKCFVGTPFAARLLPSQLRTFSSFFTLNTYEKGAVIFDKKKTGGSFYVVVEGSVDLFSLHKDGSQLAFLSAKTVGDTLDRSSLVRSARIVSAMAKTQVRCIQMTAADQQAYYRAETSEECKHFVETVTGCDPAKMLSNTPFLKRIPKNKLNLAGSLFKHVALEKNDVLFEEGSLGRSLYIVLQGHVKAVSIDKETQEVKKLLSTFEKGDVFGEISLLISIPRTASIIATKASMLLELRKDDFDRLIGMLPAKYRKELETVAKVRTAEQLRKYKVPFFKAIPDNKYPALAQLCQLDHVAEGETLFREGEQGDSFFLIVHGECAVIVDKSPKEGGAKVPTEVARMGPGSYFGEIALVLDTPRTATVTCTVASVILSITAENFNKFFTQAPEAIADFEVKLARHDVQLRSVLYHPIGVQYLEKFLQGEFSSENLAFWKACRVYRHMPEHTVLQARLANDEDEWDGYDSPEETSKRSERSSSDLAEAPGPEASVAQSVQLQARKGKAEGGDSDDEGHDSFPGADAAAGAHRYTEADYRRSAEHKTLLSTVEAVFKEFVIDDAPRQVNVIGSTKEAIKAALDDGMVTEDTLAKSVEEVQALIAADSFARFKLSDVFKEFLEKAHSYEHVEKVSGDNKNKMRSGSFHQPDPSSRQSKSSARLLKLQSKQRLRTRSKSRSAKERAIPESNDAPAEPLELPMELPVEPVEPLNAEFAA